MKENERKIHEFHGADYAVELRVPEGYKYVEESTIEEIREALEEGYAVYGEGCDGKGFVWPSDNGGFEADFFGLGPAVSKHFDDIEAAADFLAGISE
ncbi:MAG: hypothetical protein ACOCX6_00400 [bacterium]